MGAITDELQRQLYYRTRPVEWAVDYMDIDEDTLRWSQNYDDHDWDGDVDPIAQMAQAISPDSGWRRIAATSGISLGKTHTAGWLPLWFVDVNRPAFVATVAPKEDQLKLNLWKEIDRRFWEKFKELHPQAELMSLEIRMKPNEPGGDAWKIVGYVAGVGAEETTAVKARGFHQENMLIIFEEMTGVNEAVVKAFQDTSTAPNNIILGIGNADDDSDPLSSFAQKDSTKHIQISALDHPNVVLDDPRFVPGAVTRDSINEVLEDVGGDKGDSRYQSRVRGLIPTVSSDSLYKQGELRKAKEHLIHQPRMKFDHDDDQRGVEGFTEIYFEAEHDYLSKHILFMDVAGEAEGDYHAAILWNRIKRRPDAVVRMRGIGAAYIEACLSLAERFSIPNENKTWAHPQIVWETNGVGAHFPRVSIEHPTYDSLRDYPNIYYQRNLDAAGASPRKTWGFRTTGGQSGTRRKIIEELKTWARELYHYPERMVSPHIYEEARHFIKRESRGRKRYEAAPGYTDDLQMALGGAMVVDGSTQEPIPYQQQEKTQEKQLNHRAQRSLRQARQGGSDDEFEVELEQF